MPTITDDILLLIHEIQPETLLIISDEGIDGVSDGIDCTVIPCSDSLSALQNLGRFDLVLVINALKQLEKSEGEQLLGRLRNVHAKRLLLSHQPCEQWPLNGFFAFAMTELNHYQADDIHPEQQLFEYNIHSYKSVPDWLNNKFWANPNMWNKYRW